jgi:hydroxyethylthiazole kinase-like uncharacterized protein yjeF
MKILNREQVQSIESETINILGLDSLILMERAGLETFYFIKNNLSKNIQYNKHILIVVGIGNNGGDGLVLARLLHLSNIDVKVVLIGEDNKRSIENLKQLSLVKKLNINIYEYEHKLFNSLLENSCLIVDSVFGIGLKRDIQNNYLSLINQINNSNLTKLSLDIPSGIDSDSGKILGICIKSNFTITYGFNKIGLYMDQAIDYVGKIYCVDIGIPYFYANDIRTEFVDNQIIREIYPKPRIKNSFKNKYGKSLFIGGSIGMSGAIVLSAKSSLKSGLGLCSILVEKEIHNIVASQIPTAMVNYHEFNLDQNLKNIINSFDSIIFGPGIDKNNIFNENILKYIINEYDKNLIIDADGLNILSKNIDIMLNPKAKIIITPHPGEFSRLINVSSKEIQSDRIKYVKEFCNKYPKITLVLKGVKSIIANNEKIYINNTGNPILSRGGSGDILSGIIGAFSSQNINNFDSCVLSNYIHGLASDIALKDNSEHSIITEELIEYISKAFVEIERDIEKNNI